MGNLVLDSLKIQNFRAFDCLVIERLGRVNLITGKNSVGKSCLLEALRLYASNGSPTVLRDLLASRYEVQIRNNNLLTEHDFNNFLDSLKYLFHGRTSTLTPPSPFSIGRIHPHIKPLIVALVWQEVNAASMQRNVGGFGGGFGTSVIPRILGSDGHELMLKINDASIEDRFYRLSEILTSAYTIVDKQSFRLPYQSISSRGMETTELGWLWDEITLTDQESDVEEALKIILPDTQRISLVGDQRDSSQRIPVVKMKQYNGPLPMKSLGEGLERLFGIALALVNARDGFLLIDEAENGLHYSVQPDVWRIIFKLAKSLNVQVFATTHSWDCISCIVALPVLQSKRLS